MTSLYPIANTGGNVRFFANTITAARLPIIVLLALFVSTGDPTLALVLFALGMLSHACDGFIVKRGHLAPSKAGEFWHEADTAWLSLGLQLGAAFWLIRADALPWWTIAVYVPITLAIEFAYVQPRKANGRPFLPVILVGSAFVWVALAVLLGEEAGNFGPSVGALTVALGAFHLAFRTEVWEAWIDEARARGTTRYAKVDKGGEQ